MISIFKCICTCENTQFNGLIDQKYLTIVPVGIDKYSEELLKRGNCVDKSGFSLAIIIAQLQFCKTIHYCASFI